jgi:hypothetical protein
MLGPPKPRRLDEPIAVSPDCGQALMYDKWHTTTQRSYVTTMSGEECP